MTIEKVLIANRGEIAVRIVRACADAGIRSVAVYADQDADALHVRLADEAVALEGTRAAETYLDAAALVAAAERVGADAVHPGYGFLSEDAAFARAVLAAGLRWIGPRPETIEELGDKVRARAVALRVGAPLAPGTDGPVASVREVEAFVAEHGLPVVVKAAHGGGGRGMRVVRDVDEIADAYASAVREATQAFGRGECFVERFLDRPRHVEAQLLADEHGTVVVVGTRDCSVQRRHQKLLEEAPAPFLTAAQHERIVAASEAIARETGYVGAGTVEFLVADDGTIAFLEVNARLQVEHPVTEETTGVDLVREQLRIAAGERLTIDATPRPRGHAIELRINAEDPGRGFLPSSGVVTTFRAPTGPGVRVDAGVDDGAAVPPQFDSLLAKLVVWGPDRATALDRTRRALDELRIEGVATVVPAHRAILRHPDLAGDGDGFRVHTRWVETELAPVDVDDAFADADPGTALRRVAIEVDGMRRTLGLPVGLLAALATEAAPGSAAGAGAQPDASDEPGSGAGIRSPLTGSLVTWAVAPGDAVAVGDRVATVEAMKMETPVVAEVAGVVAALRAQAGAAVEAGMLLAVVEPA
ncbi:MULTISPECIES: biotin carboxylase N-terminal domain-containing protein [unclassified Agrococcus]|uniref:ATP-binding protein n=1 Tax=unclassified Agrococcus TaxID=2615065 RepID=UPI003620B330